MLRPVQKFSNPSSLLRSFILVRASIAGVTFTRLHPLKSTMSSKSSAKSASKESKSASAGKKGSSSQRTQSIERAETPDPIVPSDNSSRRGVLASVADGFRRITGSRNAGSRSSDVDATARLDVAATALDAAVALPGTTAPGGAKPLSIDTSKHLHFPRPVAAVLGCDSLPMFGQLDVKAMTTTFKTTLRWAVKVDHGVLRLEDIHFVSNGRLKLVMEHSTKIIVVRHSPVCTYLIFEGVKSEKIPLKTKPIEARSVYLKSSDFVPDAVAPNELRCAVYGPADVCEELVAGLITDNASRKPRTHRTEADNAPLAPNRLVRAVASTFTVEARKRVLVCSQHYLYHPLFASRRVRVQFDNKLTLAARFELALEWQSKMNVPVHMAGQDCVVVCDESVTRPMLDTFKSVAGVFAARSQRPPLDPLPQLGAVPTQREVAALVPVPLEKDGAVVAFVTAAFGPDPTADDWDFVAKELGGTRVGACNFHAAQIHLPLAKLRDLDGTIFRSTRGECGRLVHVTSRYQQA